MLGHEPAHPRTSRPEPAQVPVVDATTLAGARRRPRPISRKWRRFHHQAPSVERTRPRRNVIVSRNASTNDAATPAGTTHSNVVADDSVSRVRMRLRAGATGSPAAPSPRFLAGLGLLHPSFGSHQDAGARELGTPAQVDVLGSGEPRRVEPTELVEQVGPHEHGRVRHVEHVANGVVLSLVELAGLDPRVRVAELVDAASDLEQHLGIVGVDDLRADDARVRPVCLFEHEAHRPRIEHHVVVANEEEGGVPDGVERFVGRRREARLRHPVDERIRQGAGDALAGVFLRRRVDHEDCQARIVLAAQRLQRPLQPRPRVPGHHDRGDRRDLGAKRPAALFALSPERLRAGRFPTRHDCGGAYNWPLRS